MLDLDGVVYVGGDAVPGAPEHLAAAAGRRDAGGVHHQQRARPAGAVAEHLRELGRRGRAADDVVTSAQAAARVLAERLGAGAPVVLLGGRRARGGAAPRRA